LTTELAKDAVLKNKKYRKTIYNFIPDGETVALGIEAAFEKIKDLDEQYATDAERNGQPYRKYIIKEVPDKKAGTKKMVDNLVKHARRGCLSDPLPMEQMSIRIDPKDDESELLRLCGTSGGESNNKVTNRLVQNLGIQGPMLAYMKFMLRAYRWNLDKDEKLAKILGIDAPRKLEWYLHEKLKAYCIGYSKIVVPEEHDNAVHSEPIGPFYGQYKEWQKIDDMIKAGLINLRDIPAEASLAEAHQAVGSSSALTLSTPTLSTTTEATVAGTTAAATLSSPEDIAPLADVIFQDYSQQTSATMASIPTEDIISASETPTVANAAPWNQQLGRAGDTNLPASNCYRSLGGKQKKDVTKVYLNDKQELSKAQNWIFMDILNRIMNLHDGIQKPLGVDSLSIGISEAWQNVHIQQMKQYPYVGIGGLMRPNHAKKILYEKGRFEQAYHNLQRRVVAPLPIYSQQQQYAALQSSAKPPAKKARKMVAIHIHKNMTNAEIERLRYRDLQVAITKLGGTFGTLKKEEMEAKIKELLDKKEDNYDEVFEYLERSNR